MPGCPIISYLTSNINTAVNLPASNFVQNPSLVSSDYLVYPQDDTVDGKYEFYINVAAKGGAEIYSQKMTLIVGCTSDFVMTQDPLFNVGTINLMVNDPTSDIYTILPPTVSPSPPAYCPLNLQIVSL